MAQAAMLATATLARRTNLERCRLIIQLAPGKTEDSPGEWLGRLTGRPIAAGYCIIADGCESCSCGWNRQKMRRRRRTARSATVAWVDAIQRVFWQYRRPVTIFAVKLERVAAVRPVSRAARTAVFGTDCLTCIRRHAGRVGLHQERPESRIPARLRRFLSVSRPLAVVLANQQAFFDN